MKRGKRGVGEEIRRTAAVAVLSHEQGTAGRAVVAVDPFAGKVGRVLIFSAVVVGVPFGGESASLSLFFFKIHFLSYPRRRGWGRGKC